jgi:pimeloyl-ACP methyl ester carboxylesterase
MQILVHDDVRIDVKIGGDGDDAVVLLHGFPLTNELWSAQIAALSSTHRVVAPDLRGMGKSSVVDGPYLMETLAGDIAAVLDALSIERATLVGHSLGGYVALAFARMYSERIARLALVCSRVEADSRERAKQRYALADDAEASDSIDAMLEVVIPPLFAQENYREGAEIVEKIRKIAQSNTPRGLAAMQRGMALRDPASDIAGDLSMPVLVVAGASDRLVNLAEAEAVAGAFPNARLEVVKASGHLPMVEAPEDLNRVLAGFATSG